MNREQRHRGSAMLQQQQHQAEQHHLSYPQIVHPQHQQYQQYQQQPYWPAPAYCGYQPPPPLPCPGQQSSMQSPYWSGPPMAAATAPGPVQPFPLQLQQQQQLPLAVSAASHAAQQAAAVHAPTAGAGVAAAGLWQPEGLQPVHLQQQQQTAGWGLAPWYSGVQRIQCVSSTQQHGCPYPQQQHIQHIHQYSTAAPYRCAAQPPLAPQRATAQQHTESDLPRGQRQSQHKQPDIRIVPRPPQKSKKQRRVEQRKRQKQRETEWRERKTHWQEQDAQHVHMQQLQPPQQQQTQQDRWQQQQQPHTQQHLRQLSTAAGPQDPVPGLLQLPQEVLARIAACLSKQERLALARLVLSKVAPAAAAAVLGTIQSVRFCTKVTGCLPNAHPCVLGRTHVHYSKTAQLMFDAPGFLTALVGLRGLSLELGDAAQCGPVTAAAKLESNLQSLLSRPLRLDTFANLTALSALTQLQLTMQSPHVTSGKRGRKQRDAQQQQQKTAVHIVGQITSLRELSFSDGASEMQPCPGLFSGLSGLTGLQSLRLRFLSPRADLGLTQLSGLTSLTELAVQERPAGSAIASNQTISKHGLADLGPLVPRLQLQKLSISNWGPVPNLLLQPAVQLKALDLCTSVGLFATLAPRIAACTALVELRVSNCGALTIEALGIVAAGVASRLTFLDLSGNGHLAGSIDVISQLTALRHLNIQGTRISATGGETGVAAAGDQGGLGSASSDLAGGNTGVCHVLATLTRLTHLIMGCHPSTYHKPYVVPPAELKLLSALRNLQELCITGSKFDGSTTSDSVYVERAAKVGTCLSSCTSLTKLTLRGSGLGSSNADVLRDALRGGGMDVAGLKLLLIWQPIPYHVSF